MPVTYFTIVKQFLGTQNDTRKFIYKSPLAYRIVIDFSKESQISQTCQIMKTLDE